MFFQFAVAKIASTDGLSATGRGVATFDGSTDLAASCKADPRSVVKLGPAAYCQAGSREELEATLVCSMGQLVKI